MDTSDQFQLKKFALKAKCHSATGRTSFCIKPCSFVRESTLEELRPGSRTNVSIVS